jgi:hypothetical protein
VRADILAPVAAPRAAGPVWISFPVLEGPGLLLNAGAPSFRNGGRVAPLWSARPDRPTGKATHSPAALPALPGLLLEVVSISR